MAQKAKEVIESTRTPLEQLEKKIQELKAPRAKGLINQDVFKKAATNAAKELADKDKDKKKSCLF